MRLSLSEPNMRSGIPWRWSLGLVAAASLLTDGSLKQASSLAANTAPVLPPDANAAAVAPAMATAPQPVQSCSAPTVSSTPRAQPAESRPSYSAPSASAASAPASHSQSSSDNQGR
jgi:hypothetical protein